MGLRSRSAGGQLARVRQPFQAAIAWFQSPGDSLAWSGALRTALLLTTTLAIILAVQTPVLDHYFFGDDFLPLGDASLGGREYFRRLFWLDDSTPNWRFLSGVFYFAAYRAFGLDPSPYLLAAILLHVATAGLVFWFVRRAMSMDWPAAFAALLFGISAAHVPTIAYVTAFTHVLGDFLIMAAVLCLYEGLDRRSNRLAFVATSVLAYAAAIASNESLAVVAPLFLALAFWKLPRDDGWLGDWRYWRGVALLSAPYAAMGLVTLVTFSACGCTAAPDLMSFGDHIAGNVWSLLGRLLYPIGMEYPPGTPNTAHLVAGTIVAGIAVVTLFIGSGLARFSVVFLALALVPYLPMDWVLAPRHLHLASIAFAILAAVLLERLTHNMRAVSPALAALAIILAFGGVALHGWQTLEQNSEATAASEDWRTMVEGLGTRYPAVPESTTVVVVGGPLTAPIWQNVLPSVGRLLWGDDVRLATLPVEWFGCVEPGRPALLIEYDSGRFTSAGVLNAEGDAVIPAGPAGPPARPPNLIFCRAEDTS
jgi:hypothetical protein